MTPRAPRPTPSARRPTPRPRWSDCRPAWPRWKRGSRLCMRTSSDMRSSAFASTSGWAGSARSWSTSRRSRRQRGSSESGGRWMRRRSRRGSAPHANGPDALERDTASLTAQRTQWEDQLKERRLALVALESAAREAGVQVEAADARVAQTDAALEDTRKALDARGAEEHKLELERTEVLGRRGGLVARVEAEWRKPLDQLLADAPEVAGDLEWLRQEDERLRAAIDAVGPVNALAVDEHGEEVKRLEFLMTQRDDLVAARHSLQQAAREIDQTAKAMFLDSFGKVRENFRTVFQTLFGGGECDVRLANEDEPLESEIEIHAAPRGKRTQRIHLLSSGERTLVAVSLLFAIFLTKPSPFCLLDEVDAPLDDANVGRYVRLLAEFKDLTQFIVITHNPRTMQAADAVYGVTMQEPGVSTIVGVRLGQMEPA